MNLQVYQHTNRIYTYIYISEIKQSTSNILRMAKVEEEEEPKISAECCAVLIQIGFLEFITDKRGSFRGLIWKFHRLVLTP